MNPIILVYANLVRAGMKTLEEVPAHLRMAVENILRTNI